MVHKSFSSELGDWLAKPGPKTIGELDTVFGQKSFAVLFLLLLFIPALPMPTGGLSHVTEAISLLFAIEMMSGRRSLWIPGWLKQRSLGKATVEKALPFIKKRLEWLEKHSRPRLSLIFDLWFVRSILGFVIFVFSFCAMISLPFSGLDTLPALGVIIIALSMILEDALLLLVGLLVGSVGMGLIIGSGAVLSAAFRHFF